MDTIEEGDIIYYQLYFPSSGVTISLNITSGSVISYASDQYQNPNEAQGYDWRIITSSYADAFLDPHLSNSSGATLYVSIEAINTSSDFILRTIVGDRRG